jgi:hypothetical protein
MPKGLYDNINARKKAGTSRPKSSSTIDEKTYQKMKAKQDGFFQSRMRAGK